MDGKKIENECYEIAKEISRVIVALILYLWLSDFSSIGDSMSALLSVFVSL